MGSGAFLVEACRFLADELVAAWTWEKELEKIASAHEDVVNHARRLVAQRCLYGVDKNRFAVNLAKLSLWLVTLAKDLPFTFLDHALRHGDSLVGLDFDQIKSFHWKPGKQLELCRRELENALEEAVSLRQRIQELALQNGEVQDKEKKLLLDYANDTSWRVELIADTIVGAFFSSTKDKEREKERARRLQLVSAWLQTGGERSGGEYEELEGLRDELRERIATFHWMMEFPEVFYAGRRDPLVGDGSTKPGYMDAFIGNPPFAGKNGILDMGGSGYLDWLKAIHPGSHGNADYSAHFFRRADLLLGNHGTIGLIATNTIAQGDTRTTGLQKLVQKGHILYDATKNLLWPGDVAVTVSIVHSAKGTPGIHVDKHLDGRAVADINSRLRANPERRDPVPLNANGRLSFQGSIVLGMGFVLSPAERAELIARDSRNAQRVFPYIGGEEVNSSPSQDFNRYVINFGQMTDGEAKQWPDLFEIVQNKVKPERETDKREVRRKYWWRFGEVAAGLYEAIAPLERCLATAIVSKHLMFSFQPTGRVFSHKLYVFPLTNYTAFAVMQSRAHLSWAWLLSSTMRNAGINYSASDCFENFPFPRADPRTAIPELESAGKAVYEARARFMVETNQGLTHTYNLLKDQECNDDHVVRLRRLHEEMDGAVLRAYGWGDVDVPPYTIPITDAEREGIEGFEDEVIDRLFALNATRAETERLGGGQGRSTTLRHRKQRRGIESVSLPLGDPS
jgi:Eco57I restriction-modification methylase/MmeI, target recognition domain